MHRDLGIIVEHPAYLRQAGEVVVGVGFVFDRLLAVQEIGVLRVESRELADDIGIASAAAAELVAGISRDGVLKVEHDHVVIQLIHSADAVAVENLETAKLIGVQALVAGDPRQRIVVHFVALMRARAGVDPKRRREDRRAVETLAHELIEQRVERRST